MDWCKYFSDIARDPSAITPRITVRQFYECKEHINNCDDCAIKMDRLAEKNPSSGVEFDKN